MGIPRAVLGISVVLLICIIVREVFVDVLSPLGNYAKYDTCAFRAKEYLSNNNAHVHTTGRHPQSSQQHQLFADASLKAAASSEGSAASPVALLSSSLAHSAVWWYYTHSIPAWEWYSREGIQRVKQEYYSALLSQQRRKAKTSDFVNRSSVCADGSPDNVVSHEEPHGGTQASSTKPKTAEEETVSMKRSNAAEHEPAILPFVHGRSGGRGENFAVPFPLRFFHYYVEGLWISNRLRYTNFRSLWNPVDIGLAMANASKKGAATTQAAPGKAHTTTALSISNLDILESLVHFGFLLHDASATGPTSSTEPSARPTIEEVMQNVFTLHCLVLGFLSELNFIIVTVFSLPVCWFLVETIVTLTHGARFTLRELQQAEGDLVRKYSAEQRRYSRTDMPMQEDDLIRATQAARQASRMERVFNSDDRSTSNSNTSSTSNNSGIAPASDALLFGVTCVMTSLLFGTVMLLDEMDVCSGLAVPSSLLLWAMYSALAEEESFFPTDPIPNAPDASNMLLSSAPLSATPNSTSDDEETVDANAPRELSSLEAMAARVRLYPRPIGSQGRVFFFPVVPPSAFRLIALLVFSSLTCAHTVWFFFFFPIVALWFGTCCYHRAHVRVVLKVVNSPKYDAARARAVLLEEEDDEEAWGSISSSNSSQASRGRTPPTGRVRTTSSNSNGSGSKSEASAAAPEAASTSKVHANSTTSDENVAQDKEARVKRAIKAMDLRLVGMSSYYDGLRVNIELARGVALVVFVILLAFFPFARFDPAQYLDVFDLLVPTVDYRVLTNVTHVSNALTAWASVPTMDVTSFTLGDRHIMLQYHGLSLRNRTYTHSNPLDANNVQTQGESVFNALTAVAWLNNTCIDGSELACHFPTSNYWFVTDYYLEAPWLRATRKFLIYAARMAKLEPDFLEIGALTNYDRIAFTFVAVANSLPVLALIVYRLHRPPVFFNTLTEKLTLKQQAVIENHESAVHDEPLDSGSMKGEAQESNDGGDGKGSGLTSTPTAATEHEMPSSTTGIRHHRHGRTGYTGNPSAPSTQSTRVSQPLSASVLTRDEYVLKQFVVLMWKLLHCSLVCYLFLLQPSRLSSILAFIPAVIILIVGISHAVVGGSADEWTKLQTQKVLRSRSASRIPRAESNGHIDAAQSPTAGNGTGSKERRRFPQAPTVRVSGKLTTAKVAQAAIDLETRNHVQSGWLLYPLSDITWLCAFGFYLALALRPLWRPYHSQYPVSEPLASSATGAGTSEVQHNWASVTREASVQHTAGDASARVAVLVAALFFPSFSSLVRFDRLVLFVFSLFAYSLIRGRRAWAHLQSSQLLLGVHVILITVLSADFVLRFLSRMHSESRNVAPSTSAGSELSAPSGWFGHFGQLFLSVALEPSVSVSLLTAACSLVFFVMFTFYSTFRLFVLALQTEEEQLVVGADESAVHSTR